jgi:serine/threonine-protein kinase
MAHQPAETARLIQVVGRYALYDAIGSGGMASVHLGLLLGPVGFTRVVAIKRLHAQFATDPEFVSMFLDEARLAARVRHPNVVQTLDVVASDGALFVVMELVQGENLSRLLRAVAARKEKAPTKIVGAIVVGALHGLHAAHEARNARGEPLGIVHRDISPQNILIGVDGIPRVLDFGVAKAVGRAQHSKVGQLKGKLSYMAPEQLLGNAGRAADIYAASVVLWEALTGKRLFEGEDQATVLSKLMTRHIALPSKFNPKVSKEIDAVVMKGLASEPTDRYATAREMALALESVVGVVTPSELGDWVEGVASEAVTGRRQRVEELEQVEIPSTTSANRPPTGSRAGEPADSPPARPKLVEGQVERESALPAEKTRKEVRKKAMRIAGPACVVALAGGILLCVAAPRRAESDASSTASGSPNLGSDDARETAAEEEALGFHRIAISSGESLPDIRLVPSARAQRLFRAVPLPVADRKLALPAPSPSAPPPDCSTPYTVDVAGIRHPRPECL